MSGNCSIVSTGWRLDWPERLHGVCGVKSDIARRNVRFGLDQLASVENMPRHRHLHAYATVILAGAFEQYSYAGRLTLQAGDVLINPTFDCHSNKMLSRGIILVRLPWRHDATFGGVYRNLAVDTIERASACDVREAAGLLEEQLVGKVCVSSSLEDWSDKLAIDLGMNPRLRISHWAESRGITREYAWRCFIRAFDVAPTQFRSEMNARAAVLAIAHSDDPLSKISADFGFADQSHMTRAIKALTGEPPAMWRRSHRFKTSGAARAA
jgi:AraC-like DNA-binding protein